MILVVDDDPDMLLQVCTALTDGGLAAEGVTSPREALDLAGRQPPELVVSDVVMPELNGFELRQAYAAAFPERTTPFVFLSSLDDPATIVRGLELGADDYLVKPVDPTVLCAKIKVALRRQLRRAGISFRGELAALPVPALFRFCEGKGLTGWLDVFAPDATYNLRFRAGQLDDTDGGRLAQVLAVERGTFQIHSEPLDFVDLAGRGRTQPLPLLRDEAPVGRLSGVRYKDRLLQVQTELVAGAEPVIVTLVTIGGQPYWKQRTNLPPGVAAAEQQARLDAQHAEIERQIESKLAAALSTPAAPPAENVDQLCDDGYDRFRAGDYPGAIAAWERALAVDPSRRSVAVNLEVARARLASAS